MLIQRDVTIYYLEMTDKTHFRPKPKPFDDLAARQAKIPSPDLNRFFYTAVGGQWYWIDRLPWRYEQWLAYLDRPQVETWVGYWQDTPFGYFELELLPESASVDIAYFGLLPPFIGQGLGGYWLSVAVERGWALGVQRIIVNTCSLDHGGALTNYQSRGFSIYHTHVEIRTLPELPPRVW